MDNPKQTAISHSFPGYDDEVVAAGIQAMQDACFSGGRLKADAQERLASFAQAAYVQLTGTGFAALQAALVAAGVRSGDSVVIPTVTCPSVYHAVRSLNARPRVADVGSASPLIDIESVTHDLKDARFVIVPHMFGLQADLEPFHEQGRIIIEDLAQCQRPERDPLAAASVYSFSPTKLQTMGYGGAVATDDQSLDHHVQHFLSPDEPNQVDAHLELPFRIHAPIAGFQCAMLIAQLNRYRQAIECRRAWIEQYDQLLGHLPRLRTTTPFRYMLHLPAEHSAPKIARELQQRGIMAWPLASHLLHRSLDLIGDYPNAEHWQERLLSIPLHEGLDHTMVEYTCRQLLELL